MGGDGSGVRFRLGAVSLLSSPVLPSWFEVRSSVFSGALATALAAATERDGTRSRWSIALAAAMMLSTAEANPLALRSWSGRCSSLSRSERSPPSADIASSAFTSPAGLPSSRPRPRSKPPPPPFESLPSQPSPRPLPSPRHAVEYESLRRLRCRRRSHPHRAASSWSRYWSRSHRPSSSSWNPKPHRPHREGSYDSRGCCGCV